MTEIKSCPFCGREPEIAHRGGAFGFKCVCAGARFIQAYGKTEAAAKLNWNMRFFQVPQSVANAIAAKDAEIERLREVLTAAVDKLELLVFDGTEHPLVAKARAALNGGSDA